MASSGNDDRGGLWLITVLAIGLVLLIGGAGARLACDAGLIHSPLCGSDAAITNAVMGLTIADDQAVVTVHEDDGDHVATIQEPADQFASQFRKFIVVAPDGSAMLYVTADSLAMTNARLWLVPRGGGAKRLLKDLGDDLWVARPAWCQARPGEPGRIAYILKGPADHDRTGLELWIIGADGTDDRRVLVGTTANEFNPDLFYGQQTTPLRFLNGCRRLRYTDVVEDDHAIVDLDTGAVHEPVVPPAVPVVAPAAGPTPAPAAATAAPCLVKPFAQTDPRWANHVMLAGHTTIRSWGCAMTSTAMLFRYYGVDTDPGRLADCAGDHADALAWEAVRARCAADHVPTAARWSDQVSWADLERALAGGRPVIVGLQGGPAGSHFVVVTGGSGNQAANYRIIDSWDGSTYKTLEDYTNPRHGYRLRWLIIFDGVAPPCTAAAEPARSTVITFLSPADAGIYNTPQTIHYRVNSSEPNPTIRSSHPDGTVVADEGPVLVTVSVEDSGETHHQRLSFLIDRTPPEAAATWTPLSETAGRLDITGTDALTAVAEAHYRIDDGPWQPAAPRTAESHDLDLSPVTVDGLTPGEHRVRYYTVDSAGNQSAEAELVITVGPPALALLLDGTPLPLDAPVVRFAGDQSEHILTLVNQGGAPVTATLEVAALAPWVSVAAEPALPATGPATVGPGERLALRLGLRPDQLPPGHHLTELPLTLGAPARRLEITIGASETPAPPVPTPVPSTGAGSPVPPTGKPDLTATLQITGVPRLTAGGSTVPMRVVVANVGRQPAESTHLVAHVTTASGAAVVPFTTRAGDSPTPTVPPLTAGHHLTLEGYVEMPREWAGTTVSLWATVDYCGDTRLPGPACTIDEHDETNNRSSGHGVTLPSPSPRLDRLTGDGLDATPPGTPQTAARPTGSDGLSLTVEGADFTPASIVHWNGRPLPTRYLDVGHLAAEVPAAVLARPGIGKITVVTAKPGGGSSGALTLLVRQ